MTPFPTPTAPPPTPIADVDLIDPERFLEELDLLLPLTPGTTIAPVERASTAQRIVAAARLHGDLDDDEPTLHDGQGLRDLAHELYRGQDRRQRRHASCASPRAVLTPLNASA